MVLQHLKTFLQNKTEIHKEVFQIKSTITLESSKCDEGVLKKKNLHPGFCAQEEKKTARSPTMRSGPHCYPGPTFWSPGSFWFYVTQILRRQKKGGTLQHLGKQVETNFCSTFLSKTHRGRPFTGRYRVSPEVQQTATLQGKLCTFCCRKDIHLHFLQSFWKNRQDLSFSSFSEPLMMTSRWRNIPFLQLI